MTVLIAVALLIALAVGVVWWLALTREVLGPITVRGHHDFFAFYAAATLIREGRASDLYNAATLTAVERGIWPHPTGYSGYVPFLNPPSAAVLLSPLATMPFHAARAVWLGASLMIAIACALMLTAGRSWQVRAVATLLVLTSFPAYATLVEGQLSFVLLLGALGAVLAAEHGHDWLAGAASGALWLKPPLLFLVLIWLVLTRRWRMAISATATVGAVTLVCLPWTGIGADLSYVQYIAGVSVAHAAGGGAAGTTVWEGGIATMLGLLGLAATLVGQSHPLAVDLLTAATALSVLVYFIWATHLVWQRRPTPLPLVLATVSLGLLMDPHLYAHDCLLVLAPVAVTIVRMAETDTSLGALLRRVGPRSADLALLTMATLLMDLSAIDISALLGSKAPPLQMFTLMLIANVVLFGQAARRSVNTDRDLRNDRSYRLAGPVREFSAVPNSMGAGVSRNREDVDARSDHVGHAAGARGRSA